MPQSCASVLYRFDGPPSAPLSRLSSLTTPFSTRSWLTLSSVRSHESYNCVLSALSRLERASLASRSALISLVKRINWWLILTVTFASWSTGVKIGVGELPWCLITQSLIRVDCKRASVAVLGVWESQGRGRTSGVSGGVGVRNLTSSFEIADSGLHGTRPAH
jgi:hypothetical protein